MAAPGKPRAKGAPKRGAGGGATKQRQTGSKPEKKPAGPKQVSSADATGNAGGAFESRVQAHRLLSMCTRSTTCGGIRDGFRIVAIKFQTRVFGNNTDDLYCAIEDDYGARGSVRLQMKRTLRASANDEAFKEAVGLAWLDFKAPNFRPGQDFFNVIYDVESTTKMAGAMELAREAVRSISASDWLLKATAAQFSNPARRSALEAIRAVVDEYNKAAVADEELFRFMQHVQFLHEDLGNDETVVAKTLQQLIDAATRADGRLPLPPSAVWAKLIAACVDLNSNAGQVDASNLAAVIGADLDYRFKSFSLCLSLAMPQASAPLASALPSIAPAPQVAISTASPAGSALSAAGDLVPAGRDTSADKLVTKMLDHVGELIKACRFIDARAELERVKRDTEGHTLDAHQQARWYSMHGTCVWTVDDDEAAAAEAFLKAADLYEDDDKLAAARIRGLLLKGEFEQALVVAERTRERFPDSLAVWVAWSNARISSGAAIECADIPQAHMDKSVAYQMLAVSLAKRGDVQGALEAALDGVKQNDANFFNREATLRYALDLAASSPVNVAYRVATAQALAMLTRATEEFEPRDAKLWTAQIPEVLTAATRRLAYAYLLLGKPATALALVDEAGKYPVKASALVRPRIEALRELSRASEALEYGAPLLHTMPIDALVSFAQTAANQDDMERLKLVADVGRKRLAEDETGRLGETLQVMQWEVLLGQGKPADVVAQLTDQGVLQTESVPLLVLGARALLQTKDAEAAKQFTDKAVAVADASDDPANHCLVAQLMMRSKRYAEAAARYERFLPVGGLSELHTNLLLCYLRTGLRAKARDLLASFPESWRRDRMARHLAMELGQQAGDWALLQSVVSAQLQDECHLAKSWLFSLMVAAHYEQDLMDQLASEIPEVLQGTIAELTQVASAELQHKQLERGSSRLYRMWRMNMGSVDASAALHAAIAFAPERIQRLHDTPYVVAPGTSVLLTGASGASRWKTIDPIDIPDLPTTDEFLKPDSLEAAALVGKKVGDAFTASSPFGPQYEFTVKAIQTSYSRVLNLASEALHAPVAPSKHLVSVHLPENEAGQLDVNPVLRQLERREADANRRFKLYQDQTLTLGMLARMLGTDVIDIVRGWPEDGPLLQVGGGEIQERTAAVKNLESARPLLVDLSALTELALVEQLGLLAFAPNRPLVTSATRDAALQHLAESQILKPAGIAFSRGGKFGFTEYTPQSRQREEDFLRAILYAIERHCEVVPAYGPLSPPEHLPKLAAVVSHEDHAVLSAALERGAMLLTLDLRLRNLASVFDLATCWPQVFLMHNIGTQLSLRDYSVAVLTMFLRRRDFISLNVHDLHVLADQGELWLTAGVNRLRHQLALPTSDFGKAWKVVKEFLATLYGRGQCEFGVVLELFSYLLEPLLRHPLCPENFAQQAAEQVGEAIDAENGQYARRLMEFSNLTEARLKKKDMTDVTVRAQVVYCSAPPALRHGLGTGDNPLADVTRPTSATAAPDKAETSLTRPTEQD